MLTLSFVLFRTMAASKYSSLSGPTLLAAPAVLASSTRLYSSAKKLRHEVAAQQLLVPVDGVHALAEVAELF